MPTNTAGAAPGSASVIGGAIETTAGTYVAPTRWIYWETNTLTGKADVLKKPVASGTLNTGRIKRTLKNQYTGQITFPLYGTHGAWLHKVAFGSDAYLSALTADTVALVGISVN